MSSMLQKLGIDRMSQQERLDLIEEIWETMEPLSEEMPPEFRQELDRRIDAADTNPEAGIPWEVVRKRLGISK